MNYIENEKNRFEQMKKYRELIDKFSDKYDCLISLHLGHSGYPEGSALFSIWRFNDIRDNVFNTSDIYFDGECFQLEWNPESKLDQETALLFCDYLNLGKQYV